MFGEVYDADPAKLSPYVRETRHERVLDFTFQSAAASYRQRARGDAAADAVRRRRPVHDADVERAGAAHVPRQPRHGPHRLLRSRARARRAAARRARARADVTSRAASRSSTTATSRASPATAGGPTRTPGSRCSPPRCRSTRTSTCSTATTAGSVDRYDTGSALYEHIAALLAAARREPRAAATARRSSATPTGPGLRVLAGRRDREGRVPRRAEQRHDRPRRSPRHAHARRHLQPALRRRHVRDRRRRRDGAPLTIPALSAVVPAAGTTVGAPAAAGPIT